MGRGSLSHIMAEDDASHCLPENSLQRLVGLISAILEVLVRRDLQRQGTFQAELNFLAVPERLQSL